MGYINHHNPPHMDPWVSEYRICVECEESVHEDQYTEESLCIDCYEDLCQNPVCYMCGVKATMTETDYDTGFVADVCKDCKNV